MGTSGSIVWPSAPEPIWQLNWHLADSPDEEGIVISRARYRGHTVFYKASLPVLRVQYSGSCGPYKIPLSYDTTRESDYCPGTRVCIYSYVDQGYRAFSIEALYASYRFHFTGGRLDSGVLRTRTYEFEQRWVFWEDGQVSPRIYAHDLHHCSGDSRFHAYWRWDLDIDTPGNNVALEYNSYTEDQGWGRGWHAKTVEIGRTRNWSSDRSWLVLNRSSRRGYHILPERGEASADAFAYRDLWVLRYHASEDKHGNQGSEYSDDLQTYLNAEDVLGKDVVVWYCQHGPASLFTPRRGPDLMPVGNWG